MRKCIGSLRLFGLAVVLVSACGPVATRPPTTTLVTPTSESSAHWWIEWLSHQACKPPCWNNITPGVTTFDEAVSILENSPEVTVRYKGIDSVDWNFSNNDGGGTLTASGDGIVDTIWMGSGSDSKLLSKEVVASYGYPEYVKPFDCREGMCESLLLYSDLGMFLTVFVRNTGTTDHPQFEVSPDTAITRVYFIERGLESFQRIPDFQDYDLLWGWKGYGQYP